MIFNDIPLMQSHIKKISGVFKIALLLLTITEFVFIIRGLYAFNLEKLKLRMYLYSYIFLFVTSLSALIILCVCENKEQCLKPLITSIYVYAFCLIMWSAFVSAIDCYANGDSGIMVYIMTSIAVGGLALVKPWVFFIYMSASSTFLLVMNAMMENWKPYSSGFYINFAVFLLTAMFINNHNYRLSLREHEATQTLTKLSYTDQLTELYNRRRLDKHVSEHMESKTPFIFVLLDIDDFKQINDTYGHNEGDRCLVVLAGMLKERFGDRVYRFGGDEFAVIPEVGIEETCALLDDVNLKLGDAVGGMKLNISAGIYTSSPDETQTSIFGKTDRALYRAKSNSKAQWVIYAEDRPV